MSRRARLRSRVATWPLRLRLVAAVTAIALVGLVVAGALTLTEMRSYLIGRVDSELRAGAPAFADNHFSAGRGFVDRRGFVATSEQGGPEAPGPGPGRVPRLPSSFYIARFAPDGAPLGSDSAALTKESPPDLTSLSAGSARHLAGHPFTVSAVNGSGSWRVLVSLDPIGDPVAVAEPLDGVSSTMTRLLTIEVGVGVAVLLLMGGAGFFVVRRSLRPLEEVETTAAAIAGGDLTQRVPGADESTEVGRLAGALNVMLTQIEQSFAKAAASEKQARDSESRMRRFVADASHELRTPLTSIRGFAELHNMGAVAKPGDVDRAMTRIEAESTRMSGLVEDLLMLARMDAARPLEHGDVDLGRRVGEAVETAQQIAPDHALTFEADGDARVVGDDARLAQVAHNLISNAVAHTPAGTPVAVRVCGGSEAVTVEVADRGPGIAPDHLAHVFERFYRTDSARSRADGGSGLGLAIVKEIVAAHGGTVDVDSAVGEGTKFRVTLPRGCEREPQLSGTTREGAVG